jgi:hypothetical protein
MGVAPEVVGAKLGGYSGPMGVSGEHRQWGGAADRNVWCRGGVGSS